ncbi:hypothetical protein [Aeromicrobium sp. UC242_57]|uniref:hypothetical protein n=1 Tax=Aeromicrobium sp. UC242_57 TaxID=3374624 RepID=UPI00378E9D08
MTESTRPSPVILLVATGHSRDVLADEFGSRYARDYDVRTVSGPDGVRELAAARGSRPPDRGDRHRLRPGRRPVGPARRAARRVAEQQAGRADPVRPVPRCGRGLAARAGGGAPRHVPDHPAGTTRRGVPHRDHRVPVGVGDHDLDPGGRGRPDRR